MTEINRKKYTIHTYGGSNDPEFYYIKNDAPDKHSLFTLAYLIVVFTLAYYFFSWIFLHFPNK